MSISSALTYGECYISSVGREVSNVIAHFMGGSRAVPGNVVLGRMALDLREADGCGPLRPHMFLILMPQVAIAYGAPMGGAAACS